jgi:hypothetical protein
MVAGLNQPSLTHETKAIATTPTAAITLQALQECISLLRLIRRVLDVHALPPAVNLHDRGYSRLASGGKFVG